MPSIAFTCPSCHGALAGAQESLQCQQCAATYLIRDSIPVFAERDSFYEGRWAEPDHSNGSPRNWLIKKQRFFLRSLRGKQGSILDLGCGGGWRVFAQVGDAVGVDISLGSLKAARMLYGTTAVADLTALPFAAETFDFVVSSDVLGHVPLEKKDRVLAEIHRVLRKGGRTLHYIEADSIDPLSRFGKRFPDLYHRYVIEPEGHIGVELPDRTTERFRRAGFRPIKECPSYKLFLYVNRLPQYFDNEYRTQSRTVSLLVNLCRIVLRVKPLEMGANVLISLAFEVGDRLLPDSWANGVLVEYERPGGKI